jgi:hypothetical protein
MAEFAKSWRREGQLGASNRAGWRDPRAVGCRICAYTVLGKRA